MSELKPCPFCGRKPSKVREHKTVSISTVFYSVACKAPDSKCGAKPMTHFHTTREKAIEAWNKRAEEAVCRGVLDQVRWERDIAIGQLESYGISLGEKADVAKVMHGHWVSLTECANAGVYCSVCNKKVYKEDYAFCNRKNKLRSNYCPNCGAKMDGDGNV